MDAKGEGEEWMNWEVGIDIYIPRVCACSVSVVSDSLRPHGL